MSSPTPHDAAAAAAVTRFDPLAPLPYGVTLIEASAGTGKTYTITTLVLRLVVEQDVSIDKMLIVTFTEAATAELQGRVRTRLRDALAALDALPEPPADPVLLGMLDAARAQGEEQEAQWLSESRRRLGAALASFDLAAISTIHGFCQRTLREHAFESGIVFDTELVADVRDMLGEAIADFWVNRQHQGDRPFLRYLELLGEQPDSLIQLARDVTADPRMPVIPNVTGADAPQPFQAWHDAFEATRAEWVAHRDLIMQIVDNAVSSGRLKGTSYQPAQLPKRWLRVGAWLAGESDQMSPPPEELAKFFTRTALREKAKKGEVPPHHPFFDAADRLTEAWDALERSFDERRVALERRLVDFVREEFPRRKRRAGVQSFDDLLNELDLALSGPARDRLVHAVRTRYEVALIDEFQDTDPVQYRIFGRIFAERQGGRLFLIGDPKQAIYGFRGADIFAYVRAAEQAANKRTLAQNFRSAPKLVRAVNALFAEVDDPFVLDAIRFYAVDPADSNRATLDLGGDDAPLGIALLSKQHGSPPPHVVVARSIVRLIESDARIGQPPRPVEPRDIAVLVRTNWEGERVRSALARAGVPCVMQETATVFDTPEAADVHLVLAALAEPGRLAGVRAALTTCLFGFTGDDLVAMDADLDAWELVIDDMRAWRELWRSRGFVHAFRAILAHPSRRPGANVAGDDEETAPSRILGRDGGERRMTNLLHLAELLHDAETKDRLSPAGLVRWLGARRLDGGGTEADQLRMESDSAAVKITTIHKAKGLEFPIVYCPYLSAPAGQLRPEDRRLRFHDRADDRRVKLTLQPNDAAREQAEEEGFAEGVRLLYVALTRAKERCVVYLDVEKRDFAKSPLVWLLFGRAGEHHRATAERVARSSTQDLLAELRSLSARAAGEIRAGFASDGGGDIRLRHQTASDVELSPRTVHRAVRRSWTVTSFTGLVDGLPPHGGPAEEGRDHDTSFEPDPSLLARGASPIPLADLVGGARAGRMMHQIFEHTDFQRARDAATCDVVERALRLHGFDTELWTDATHAALADAIETPLDATGLRLADVPRSARLNELGFVMPLRSDRKQDLAARLAAAIARHGGPRLQDTAAAVARLDAREIDGFLKGFVDLAFRHAGRWYVCDYKSNMLGRTLDAYAQPRLERPMTASLYTLQYLLYTVALARYLRTRDASWSYATGFGGVFYLFVRGMSPAHGAAFGVYSARPTAELVAALDEALDPGDPARTQEGSR